MVLQDDIHKEINKENFDDINLQSLNNVEKMMHFDTERYLPDDLRKVDRASMYHS